MLISFFLGWSMEEVLFWVCFWESFTLLFFCVAKFCAESSRKKEVKGFDRFVWCAENIAET